jgi:hypothetical protein
VNRRSTRPRPIPFYRRAVGVYQRLFCRDCGSISRFHKMSVVVRPMTNDR